MSNICRSELREKDGIEGSVRFKSKNSSLIGAFFLDRLTLNMKVLRSFETSLTIYKPTRHNASGDLHFKEHRCEKLKSGKTVIL